MKKIIILLTCICCFFTFFTGCSNNNSESSSQAKTDETMFTSADLENGYGTTQAEVVITLNGNTATCSSTTNYVKLGTGYVIISGAGLYVLTGSSENLIVYVQADKSLDKVKLVFRDLTMLHSSFAPIYVKSANKTFIYAEGESHISTTGAFVQKDTNNVDGAIFSKDDLCIKGSGVLNVTDNYGHGIVAKDDLKIVNTNIIVNCSGHGIDANDSVRIKGAYVSIDSGEDGIKVENVDYTNLGFFYMSSGNVCITASHDGIDCSESFYVLGGEFKIVAGDSGVKNTEVASKNAIKATTSVTIKGGNFLLYSSEKSIKASKSTISGATILAFSADENNSISSAISFSYSEARLSIK